MVPMNDLCRLLFEEVLYTFGYHGSYNDTICYLFVKNNIFVTYKSLLCINNLAVKFIVTV